jgi:hypothetical protein
MTTSSAQEGKSRLRIKLVSQSATFCYLCILGMCQQHIYIQDSSVLNDILEQPC